MLLVHRVLVLVLVSVLVVEGAPRPKPVKIPVKKSVESNELKALDYLEKYGYLGKNVKTKMALKDSKSAIAQFQKMAGLKTTGLLDAKTMTMMDKPRCGMADQNQSRDYVSVARWPKKDLTYTITKYPASTLNSQQVDQEIARAFQVWADHTDLTFRVVDRRQRADINIRFEKYNHDDGSPFDGPGGTLAHAFFPTDGKTHFDDTERWTMHDHSGINLFQVAAHEFGHSLGLDHSGVRDALMAPFYQSYQPAFQLHNDDKEGIQRLYGRKTNYGGPAAPPNPPPNYPPPKPQPPPTNPNYPEWPSQGDLCQDLAFDTIFTDLQGVTYVIKGSQYWELGIAGVPRDVQRKWPGLPGHIDAAFSHRDIGKTYFFSGAHVWRFDGDRLDQGFPRPISERFPGIPDNVDAAFVWSRNNQIYFFKGSQYWKYDYTMRPSVGAMYPQQIGAWWRVVPDHLDAAFTQNGRTYFVKGASYGRLMDGTLSLDMGGYSSISTLFGCPNNQRFVSSSKDQAWMKGLKTQGRRQETPKKLNRTTAKLTHVESLRLPNHTVCSKSKTCKKFP